MNTSLPSSGPEMDSVDLANTVSAAPAVLEGQFSELTRAQRLALEWLISGGSVNDAAQFAGVCRQTVSKWLHGDREFKKAYDDWREEINVISSARLVALTESAIDNISTAIRQGHDVKTSQFLVKHLALQRRENL